jgi:hypothetical protein
VAGRAASRTRVAEGKAWRHLPGQAMPGRLLVRVPRPIVETASVWVASVWVASVWVASVWVASVAFALAGLAVVVAPHAVLGPGQERSRPTRVGLDQMDAAGAATSKGPRNHPPRRGLDWAGVSRSRVWRWCRTMGMVASFYSLTRRRRRQLRHRARVGPTLPTGIPSAAATSP